MNRSILARDGVQRQAPKAKAIVYPAYRNVSFNATVRSAMWEAWKETVRATTKTTRREQGFWIQWDTTTTGNANGTYRITGASTGPTVKNHQTANMKGLPAKPADSGDWHTVGYFHTHTPTRFRAGSRAVGPSGADGTFHTSNDVTGIVRDYVGKAGVIPAGHPLWGASQYYHSGPTRRT